MNKTLIIASLLAATTTASAAFNISGTYEGTVQDGTGAATYSQDLDLKLVGSVNGASVTATMENLSSGTAVTTNELYVNAEIVPGFDFQGGNFKALNGNGLLEKKSAAANRMMVTAQGVSVIQASGDGNASVDVDLGMVKINNALESDRFISGQYAIAGLNLTGEYQKQTAGTNYGITASATLPVPNNLVDVTGVFMDVEGTITQDDGILGDVSDASGKVKGVVVTAASNYGVVTGKVIEKNNLNTYVGELGNGIMTYSYSKTEDTDGVAKVKIAVNF